MQIYQPQLKLMSFCTVQLRIVILIMVMLHQCSSDVYVCFVLFFMNVGWSLQSSADS